MAGSAVDALLLAVAGLLLLAGGVAHPFLPPDEAGQMEVLPGDAVWVASHWALTVGQAFAAAGVVGLVRATTPRSRLLDSLLWSGALLVAGGFLVGVLGTLTAATALVEAARQGPGLFAVVNEGALALGRLCMLLVGVGSAMVGAALLPRARGFGGAVAVAGVVAVATVLAFPPHHPWTHDGVLRAGALAGGLVLLAAGWRVRRTGAA